MRVLITGGAGFIGVNAARRFIERGDQVTVYDNLSRHGSRENLAWLSSLRGAAAFEVVTGDVRDAGRLVEEDGGPGSSCIFFVATRPPD